jgi:hypothetical protein
MFASSKITYHAFLKTADYESYCTSHGINAIDLKSYFLGVPHDHKTIDCILAENMFIRPEFQAYAVRVCLVAMKKYNHLLQFVRLAMRRRKRSVCENDLSLYPLSTFRPNALYDAVDRGCKYTFRTSDLISIIHASLTRSHEFICDPVPVKNPYTGQVFQPAVLYRFFLHLNLGSFTVPVLFSLFMSVDFKVESFLLKFEPLIRDIVIKSEVDNMPLQQKDREIRRMLQNTTLYDTVLHLNIPIIDNLQITPALILKLRPLLHHYFIFRYSLNPYYKQASQSIVLKTILSYVEI